MSLQDELRAAAQESEDYSLLTRAASALDEAQPTDSTSAIVDAISKLHYQQEYAEDVIPFSCIDGDCEHGDEECPEVCIKPCAECSGPEYLIEWPCPTLKQIEQALKAAADRPSDTNWGDQAGVVL